MIAGLPLNKVARLFLWEIPWLDLGSCFGCLLRQKSSMRTLWKQKLGITKGAAHAFNNGSESSCPQKQRLNCGKIGVCVDMENNTTNYFNHLIGEDTLGKTSFKRWFKKNSGLQTGSYRDVGICLRRDYPQNFQEKILKEFPIIIRWFTKSNSPVRASNLELNRV